MAPKVVGFWMLKFQGDTSNHSDPHLPSHIFYQSLHPIHLNPIFEPLCIAPVFGKEGWSVEVASGLDDPPRQAQEPQKLPAERLYQSNQCEPRTEEDPSKTSGRDEVVKEQEI